MGAFHLSLLQSTLADQTCLLIIIAFQTQKEQVAMDNFHEKKNLKGYYHETYLLAMYKWLNRLQSLFEFSSASLFLCFFFVKGLLKRGREFFLIGCWIGMLRSFNTSYTYFWYCSIPSYSMFCTVATIASPTQFWVSNTKSSVQSFKKEFPMFAIT